MLQIEAVAFGDFAVYGLFYPGDFVDEFVTILIHHINRKPILGIDDPDE